MKISGLLLAAMFAFVLSSAVAQSSVPASNTGASAPRPAKPPPRRLTPAEMRDSASSPADEPPAGAVTPQIIIPLGKKPAPPLKPYSRAARRDAPATPGGIDDAAARCEAQASEAARAECRDKLTRAGRKP